MAGKQSILCGPNNGPAQYAEQTRLEGICGQVLQVIHTPTAITAA